MVELKSRLKEIRSQKKVLQKDIAEYLNLPLRTYQSYEYGEAEPSNETLVKLADYFDVTTDYLLGRTNYWQDTEGQIKVKVPLDILNLDTKAMKKTLRKNKRPEGQ